MVIITTTYQYTSIPRPEYRSFFPYFGSSWLFIGYYLVYRGSLTNSERLDYIDAVKCLQATPARTPASVASGAKTRFDDFVATHINQTLTIHYTGSFLSWHRYFVWLYEQALKEECGYKGISPVSDFWSKPTWQEQDIKVSWKATRFNTSLLLSSSVYSWNILWDKII